MKLNVFPPKMTNTAKKKLRAELGKLFREINRKMKIVWGVDYTDFV